jgi:small subunit ribosomal protein S15
MALTPKSDIVAKFGPTPTDTGSPEVQIACSPTASSTSPSTSRPTPKDHHSRRGLLMLVGRRRRMLDYINATSTSSATASSLIAELGLRR